MSQHAWGCWGCDFDRSTRYPLPFVAICSHGIIRYTPDTYRLYVKEGLALLNTMGVAEGDTTVVYVASDHEKSVKELTKAATALGITSLRFRQLEMPVFHVGVIVRAAGECFLASVATTLTP